MLALVGVAVEAVLAVRVVVAAPAQVTALGARAALPHAAAVLGSQGQEVPPGANNFRVGSQLQTSAANRLIGEVVQSRRRPLLGPSPG